MTKCRPWLDTLAAHPQAPSAADTELSQSEPLASTLPSFVQAPSAADAELSQSEPLASTLPSFVQAPSAADAELSQVRTASIPSGETPLSNTIAAAIPAPDRQAVTRLLFAWQSGDSDALERLTPLIYEELRNRARRYMQRERPGHTLQATAVVHEAFVKLVEMNVCWQDRAHFFAVAARQMRRILVDHAKTRFRDKRGSATTDSLEELQELDIDPATAGDIDVLEIDEALQRLAAANPQLAQLVELHYFGGLTYQELSETLKVSEATIDRDIRLAKAWVLKEIRPKRTAHQKTHDAG